VWTTQSREFLRHVIFDLQPDWEKEARMLAGSLEKDGVFCTDLTQEIRESAKSDRRGTVVLTDSAPRGKELARMGIVYFGCSHIGKSDFENSDSSWFDGAALVLESFEEVDARYLEEWMLRAQGRPAVIAKTDCLEIREMAEQDRPDLVRIGRGNPGSAFTAADVDVDGFSQERFSSYINTAYRLQGFGLWSVLYQGRVIGCCGFAPWDGAADGVASENAGQKKEDNGHMAAAAAPVTYMLCLQTSKMNHSKIALELQYMLDGAYQRQGFGSRMCRMALEYARDRLDAEEIYLRIRPDNQASIALAKKLHFMEVI